MHPDEAAAYVEAWRNREDREDIRNALIRYTVAVAGGMKKNGGGRLKLRDFLTEKPKTPEQQEAELKARLMSMAKRTK